MFELVWFNFWYDVYEYCEINDGSDIKFLVKLVDDYGIDLFKKVFVKIMLIE